VLESEGAKLESFDLIHTTPVLTALKVITLGYECFDSFSLYCILSELFIYVLDST
jgi:hypothetical protein